MAEQPQVETWKNNGNGNVWVWKIDRLGNLKDEVVKSGQKFTITTDERLLNSERASGPDMDIFRNGALAPVRLIEGSEDARELAENPNLIAESEMAGLFKLKVKDFEDRLTSITNETVLRRLKAIAEDEETGATLKQVRKIEERLEDIVHPVAPEDTTGPRVGGQRAGAGPRDTGERTSKAVTP